MTGFFEGISNFFARHRAHCPVHEIYQSDCEECVAANQTVYIDSGTDVIVNLGGDSFMSTDSSSADNSSADSWSADSSVADSSCADSSSTDSSSCDASDFGGFGGGDSGGGGASGDF